jgi:hypothetical protein
LKEVEAGWEEEEEGVRVLRTEAALPEDLLLAGTATCCRKALKERFWPDTAPGVEPDTTPGVEPDTAPGVEPNTDPGVEPDTAFGLEPNTAPDTTPGVEPNTAPRVMLEGVSSTLALLCSMLCSFFCTGWERRLLAVTVVFGNEDVAVPVCEFLLTVTLATGRYCAATSSTPESSLSSSINSSSWPPFGGDVCVFDQSAT